MSVILNNGVSFPLVGLGTSAANVEVIEQTLRAALEAGYRLIDTAMVYQNQPEIGNALEKLLRELEIDRKDLTIVTKIYLAKEKTAEETERQVRQACAELKIDYIDCVFIHYPTYATYDSEAEVHPKNKAIRMDSYRTLLDLQSQGVIKTVGVSNYEIRHLQEIENEGLSIPSILQVEYHPCFVREALHQYCKVRNIFFQAFTSLAGGQEILHKSSILDDLSRRYQASKQGILLAFATSQGIGVIPKSNTPSRIQTNFREANEVKLNEEDIDALKTFNMYSDGSVVNRCKGWKVF